jgi:hypothetical protein
MKYYRIQKKTEKLSLIANNDFIWIFYIIHNISTVSIILKDFKDDRQQQETSFNDLILCCI